MTPSQDPGPEPPFGVDRRVLPVDVAATLLDTERVLYWAQPIRHSLGIGVWMIFALGPIFAAAGAGAVEEIIRRGILEGDGASQLVSFGIVAGAVLLFAVGFVFLTWPLLSYQTMRRTHIVVTPQRVLKVVVPSAKKAARGDAHKVTQWRPSQCDALNVVRRRGASATLVLSERTEERRSDGRMVYRWEALHGLPRAREAHLAVDWVRQCALGEVHSSV